MNTCSPAPKTAAVNRESITQLMTRFYGDIRAGDPLGPTFDAVPGARWATQLPRLVEFRSTVVPGSRSFSGKVFGKHLAVPGATPLHLKRWPILRTRHTQVPFAPATARRLQEVASRIARNLYRGYFGQAAGFDGIESELRHDCR